VVFVYVKPRYEGLNEILSKTPNAQAVVNGSPGYESIHGMVFFYEATGGVLVVAQVQGLPQSSGPCPSDVFGFHIHSGSECTGNEQDPFTNTGAHYNPEECPHPAHAGDLPPLFGCNGYAFLAFFTNRFTIRDILGKTILIHRNPDDFTTQPAGNSGAKIACGEITANQA
jgi:superoxide dismutase, Cu-Zn family